MTGTVAYSNPDLDRWGQTKHASRKLPWDVQDGEPSPSNSSKERHDRCDWTDMHCEISRITDLEKFIPMSQLANAILDRTPTKEGVCTIIVGSGDTRFRVLGVFQENNLLMYLMFSSKVFKQCGLLHEGTFRTGRDVKLVTWNIRDRRPHWDSSHLFLLKNRHTPAPEIGGNRTRLFLGQQPIFTKLNAETHCIREKEFLEACKDIKGISKLQNWFLYVSGKGETKHCFIFHKQEGNLAQFLKKGSVPLEMVRKIQFGLLQALWAIHEKGFIHRDLKPENVLLDREYKPSICDFGLSHKKGNEVKESGGSSRYIAPEVAHAIVRFREFESKIEGSMAPHKIAKLFVEATDFPQDVYSLGVVFQEMNNATQNTMTDDELLCQRAAQYEERESHKRKRDPLEDMDVDSLIEAMTDPDPKRRITAKAAIRKLQEISEIDEQLNYLAQLD